VSERSKEAEALAQELEDEINLRLAEAREQVIKTAKHYVEMLEQLRLILPESDLQPGSPEEAAKDMVNTSRNLMANAVNLLKRAEGIAERYDKSLVTDEVVRKIRIDELTEMLSKVSDDEPAN
jgi:hypothetical protein